MGADYGIGIIHVALNYLGFSDVWANWVLISILFALNSWGLYLLLNKYFDDTQIAIAGSLLFSFAHFTLANLENPNTLVFFPAFLSLFYYLKYLDDKKRNIRALYTALLIGAFQIYLSPYVFLFHSILWSILIVYYEFSEIKWGIVKKYFLGALVYLLIISPYLYLFVLGNGVSSSYNVIREQDLAWALSLNIEDYIRALPNHLYINSNLIFGDPFVSKIKSAYLGIVFYLLALFGFIIDKNKRWPWGIVFITGILIATGPFVTHNYHKLFPSLLYPLYEVWGFDNIFRLPFRAFFISVIALIVFATAGLKHIKDRFQGPIWFVIVLLILFENVPLRMEVYDHSRLLNPDTAFIEPIRDYNNATILSLPSGLFEYKSDRREYVYMYWQYYHHQNILNGNLAFIPTSRMKIYQSLNEFSESNLESLIDDYESHILPSIKTWSYRALKRVSLIL